MNHPTARCKTATLHFLLFILLTAPACKNRSTAPVLPEGVRALPDAENRLPDWPADQSVVVVTPAEPDLLHPTDGSGSLRMELFRYLHGFLINVDQFHNPQAALLNSLPDVSSDQLSYSCKLKNGITWDDGTPLTAADVEFTVKVNKAPFIHSKDARSACSKIKSIRCDPDDPLKFTIVMQRKDLLNLLILSDLPIIEKSFHDPQHILDRYTVEQLVDTALHQSDSLIAFADRFNDGKFGREPAYINGLGDYRLKSWMAGESIVLERKPGATRSMPEKIMYRFSSDEAGVVTNLKEQSYDISLNLSPKSFFEAVEDPSIQRNYHGVMTLANAFSSIFFNIRPDTSKRKPLFVDKDVRMAIAKLVPTDDIIRLIYRNYSMPSQRMGSCVMRSKTECDTTLLPLTLDRQAASELLTKAGWIDADNDGILDRNGIKLEAELLYLNVGTDFRDIAALIASSLSKSGIIVHPVPVDPAGMTTKGSTHDFDMILRNLSNPSAYEDFSQLYYTNNWKMNGSNWTGFGTAQTESLIDSINSTGDVNQRVIRSRRLQRIIYEEQPIVFLYRSLRRNLIHKRWGNVVIGMGNPAIELQKLELIK